MSEEQKPAPAVTGVVSEGETQGGPEAILGPAEKEDRPQADEAYPDPRPMDLVSPLFNVIWDAIKGWDISRYNDGLYSGPTGNDVMHIVLALHGLVDANIEELRQSPDKLPGSPAQEGAASQGGAIAGSPKDVFGPAGKEVREQADEGGFDCRIEAAKEMVAFGIAPKLAEAIAAPVICDGCNVREPWEHKCHSKGQPLSHDIMVRGERVYHRCECHECNPNEEPILQSMKIPARIQIIDRELNIKVETRTFAGSIAVAFAQVTQPGDIPVLGTLPPASAFIQGVGGVLDGDEMELELRRVNPHDTPEQ